MTPAELLLSQGQPELVPIPGTTLLYVSNSGNDIFMDTSSQMYYVLAAGRWFVSNTLQNGDWSYVPGSSLPADFAKIPPSNPKASVLVSVPGTPQAKEAVIANQIPQTAAISRNAAKLQVNYHGAPDFQPIPDTALTYAVNTHDAGYSSRPQVLLCRREWCLVYITRGRRAVDGSDLGACRDLYDSSGEPDSLRCLRVCL